MFYNLNGIRTEIKQLGNTISKQLINIKNDIPYQSEIEIENKKLLDSNVKLKEQLKQIEGSLISLQEVNEKLLKYIEEIDEVKQSGGIKTQTFDYFNPIINRSLRQEIKIIPELKIARLVEAERDD